MARTRWMFGFQRRLVRRCEWLTLLPNDGFLPQTSHVDAIVGNLYSSVSDHPGTWQRYGVARGTHKLRARRRPVARAPIARG